MKKVLVAGGISLFLFSLGYWYFFYKEFAFTVSFTTKASPSIASGRIKKANFEDFSVMNLPSNSTNKIIQKVQYLENERLLKWTISRSPGSVTKIVVGVNSPEDSVIQRFNYLLGKRSFMKKLLQEIKELRQELDNTSELFDVEVIGETISPAANCACLPLKSRTEDKAFQMMKSINLLSEFVLQHGLEMAGKPRVDVRKWSTENGYISFDFCFPLQRIKEFPAHSQIFQKKIQAQPALKAIYRGNYMHSYEAWFVLYDHALEENIAVKHEPLEIFLNNPEMGGSGRHWKAEIYLPLKKE